MSSERVDEQASLTGYPSVDKPWLKYYSEEAVSVPLFEGSMYEHIVQGNQDFPSNVALNYMGTEITYGELFRQIDRAAASFAALGLRRGDVVTGITPAFPEVIYAIYALNKIGVLTDWLDLRTDKEHIVAEMRETGSRVLLAFDEFLPSFAERISETDVETVISFSKVTSLPMPLRLLAKLKTPKSVPGAIAYPAFIKAHKSEPAPPTVANASDLPALLEHTGGTTGEPKAVILTNRNVTSVMEQYRRLPVEYTRDTRYLSIGFPFVAYALIGSLHDPLVLGTQCHLCYSPDAEAMISQLLKNKVDQMATTPMMWEQMMRDPEASSADLSFITMPIVGADELAPEKEQEINEFLRSHGCEHRIAKGYGMTELASSVCLTPNDEINKVGSLGIPYPQTLISVFEPGTENELRHGEEGEICVSGPSVMQGYYGRSDATAEVLREHADGRVWMHTGDLGYMDEDGFLFLKGRIKRMFANHMGFKVFAPQVERVILQCESVDQCCVVGKPDKEHGAGRVPVAFVVPKKDAMDVERHILEACKSQLSEWQVPQEVVLVDEFPYTSAGKVDYRKLEELAKDKG